MNIRMYKTLLNKIHRKRRYELIGRWIFNSDTFFRIRF